MKNGGWHRSLDAFRVLLIAALNACKSMDAKYMTYFCGEEERMILSEMGFHCVGQYVLYIKKVLAAPVSRQ